MSSDGMANVKIQDPQHPSDSPGHLRFAVSANGVEWVANAANVQRVACQATTREARLLLLARKG